MNPILIAGGAGFIGCNLARRLVAAGHTVRILDNLSRKHVDRNLAWLRAHGGASVDVRLGDVRDRTAVERAVAGVSAVFHFAAQVAVTTSISNPMLDFEINAGGTINILEALRAQVARVPLVFTSTNKVYGALADVRLRCDGKRYVPEDETIAQCGINERRALDFYSPYGCSKGAADQYVLDYARTYGMPNVVLRMSCIYGPRQFGNEDQGWVAHFARRVLEGGPVKLYGDGRQVRDLLYVDDLVDVLLLVHANIERVRGMAFNVGGGMSRSASLLELLDLLGAIRGSTPQYELAPWRPGDQRYYVSDTHELEQAVGWVPRVSLSEGVHRLCGWLGETMVRPRRSWAILEGGAS